MVTTVPFELRRVYKSTGWPLAAPQACLLIPASGLAGFSSLLSLLQAALPKLRAAAVASTLIHFILVVLNFVQ
jgi:hypothetical protein